MVRYCLNRCLKFAINFRTRILLLIDTIKDRLNLTRKYSEKFTI